VPENKPGTDRRQQQARRSGYRPRDESLSVAARAASGSPDTRDGGALAPG